MDATGHFLNNPWVTGIGGGVISGLIVLVITRWLFSNQKKREMMQRVNSANREVIVAIRSDIDEGQFPSIGTVHALIRATARKFNISEGSLYSPKEVSEELMKEVVDSKFLSASKKNSLCDKIYAIGYQNDGADKIVKSMSMHVWENGKILKQYTVVLSTMVGMIGAPVGFLVAGVIGDDASIKKLLTDETFRVFGLVIGLGGSVGAFITLTIFYFSSQVRSRNFRPLEKDAAINESFDATYKSKSSDIVM